MRKTIIKIPVPGLPFQAQIDAQFALLLVYHKNIEKLLERAQKEVTERFAEMTGERVPLKYINPALSDEFPWYLRYSFVALLALFTETLLEDVCKELGKRRKLGSRKRYKAFKGAKNRPSNFHHVRAFLQQYLIYRNPHQREQWAAIDKLWQESIEFLRILRNCIMHAGGEVERLRNENERTMLNVAKKQWPGYRIRGKKLVLRQDFCEELRKRVQSFFTNMFTLFPSDVTK